MWIKVIVFSIILRSYRLIFTKNMNILLVSGTGDSKADKSEFQPLDRIGKEKPIAESLKIITENHERRHPRILLKLGIIEIVFAAISISIAIGVAYLATDRHLKRHFSATVDKSNLHYADYQFGDSCYGAMSSSYMSQGIWCGVFAVITGILGIFVNYKTSKAVFFVNFVMATMTATAVCGGVVFSGFAASFSESCSSELVVLNLSVALLCFSTVIITIAHAYYSCRGICSGEKRPPCILV